jgi:15-cis-phytoene synthase
MSIADAYARCEAITRTQAVNFHYGIRLLPGERRRSMCAVYAFARRVDDIGDGPLEQAQKLRLLAAEGDALAAIGSAHTSDARGDDPVTVALADTGTRFALPAGALAELIDGVRMDVEGTTYEAFADLVPYCRRVAGAIGRLCLAIFGLRDGTAVGPHAEALADDLGVALQLTNILRDVREDAANGRVYLPREDLRRFGLIGPHERDGAPEALQALTRATVAASANGGVEDRHELAQLTATVRFEAARAREWFDRGLTLVGLLDRRSAACVLAMAGIYRRLLQRIELDPEQAARERMSLPAHEKAWVAARGMLGVAG